MLRRALLAAAAGLSVLFCATAGAAPVRAHAVLPSWAFAAPGQALSASASAPLLAVWISGDGGWGRMERETTRRLAEAGVPTLGIDSLRYFAKKRAPAEAARDIAAALAAYDPDWMNKRIILIGFSFGADIGPFIVHDLPPALRDRLAEAAFLSPARRSNLQVSPASWLGIGLGPQVWPALSSLAPIPVLCIGGAGVFADICPVSADAPAGMVSVRLSGGHELSHQYDAIARLILEHAGTAAPGQLEASR